MDTYTNTIDAYLQRGFIALNDEEWEDADSFFEAVLNTYPTNALAYIGKTLIMEQCPTLDAFLLKRKKATIDAQAEIFTLEPCDSHIDEMVQKYSLEFYVDESAIRKLYDYDLTYKSEVADRRRQYYDEEVYWEEHKLLSHAIEFADGTTAETLSNIKEQLFTTLSERLQKAQKAETTALEDLKEQYRLHCQQADLQAEQLYEDGIKRREIQYQHLIRITSSGYISPKELTNIAIEFEKMNDYKDSIQLAAYYHQKAVEDYEKHKAAKAEKRQAAPPVRKTQEQSQKQSRRHTLIGIAAVAVVLIALIILFT